MCTYRLSYLYSFYSYPNNDSFHVKWKEKMQLISSQYTFHIMHKHTGFWIKHVSSLNLDFSLIIIIALIQK